MNIQIFGASKSFDTKKAERWFKERRIKFQAIDVRKYGMSRGELSSVRQAVGLEAMIDPKHPDYTLLEYLASDQAKLDKLYEDPTLLNLPIVRNGKQATVGYCRKSGNPGPDRPGFPSFIGFFFPRANRRVRGVCLHCPKTLPPAFPQEREEVPHETYPDCRQ